MSGQRCLGSDNVAVIGDDKRYGEIKEKLIAAARAMKMGYGLDDTTELGPLTTKNGRNLVAEFIERVKRPGPSSFWTGVRPR